MFTRFHSKIKVKFMTIVNDLYVLLTRQNWRQTRGTFTCQQFKLGPDSVSLFSRAAWWLTLGRNCRMVDNIILRSEPLVSLTVLQRAAMQLNWRRRFTAVFTLTRAWRRLGLLFLELHEDWTREELSCGRKQYCLCSNRFVSVQARRASAFCSAASFVLLSEARG